MPHRISIALTCLQERDGWIHPHLAGFLMAWQRRPEVGGPVHLVYNCRPFHNARNQAVKLFLKSPSDWLSFIDNDTVPPAKIFGLFGHLEGRDIVAVPYPYFRTGRDGQWCLADCVFTRTPDGALEPARGIDAAGFHEITACGAGMMLVNRRVFEKLEPPYFRNVEGAQSGEDVDFCLRAREAGFKIWTTADYGKALHYKTAPLGNVAGAPWADRDMEGT